MNLQQPHDVWEFSGDDAMNGTLDNTAAAEGQSADPPFTTNLAIASHGLKAGSLVYITGTTNYDGLKLILSLPDTNSIMIKSPFVIETPGGSETWGATVTYDRILRNAGDIGSDVAPGPPWEFLGFDLTLDAAAGTSADFQATVSAKKGTAWDNLVYSKDMNGITNINYMFDEPRKMESGDKIDFTWANADGDLWGLKVYTRRSV